MKSFTVHRVKLGFQWTHNTASLEYFWKHTNCILNMEISHCDIMKLVLDAIFSTLAKILHDGNFQSISKMAWSVKKFSSSK